MYKVELMQVYIGEGLLEADALVNFTASYPKVILICDAYLKELYAEPLAKKLNAHLLFVPSGESAKSLSVVDVLQRNLAQLGADRETLLVAMGGGTVSDLVGFVASIYLRGLPLLLIPTTLLAMVDAAIGGKNGINTTFGKNQLGTIYLPRAMVADVAILKTLPEKQWRNGLAELLKIGLVYEPKVMDFLKRENALQLVTQGARAKSAVVEQDLMDHGIRHILNFGHTIGHALEAATGYDLSHGEAVAIGALVESSLSLHLGFLSRSDYHTIQQLYAKHLPGLKLSSNYCRERCLQALLLDKKRRDGSIRTVVLQGVGSVFSAEGEYCVTVSNSMLETVIKEMELNFFGA